MSLVESLHRPRTLAEVAEGTRDLSEFGRNLRDWQHEIRRGGVHSKASFSRSLNPEPVRLRHRFDGGDIADATLAAYAEWLADRADLPRPDWCADPLRVASRPWFGTPLRGHLLATTPASFRQRNLFTLPEPVFFSRQGRPRVSLEQKREKSRLRQQAYRDRQRQVEI